MQSTGVLAGVGGPSLPAQETAPCSERGVLPRVREPTRGGAGKTPAPAALNQRQILDTILLIDEKLRKLEAKHRAEEKQP